MAKLMRAWRWWKGRGWAVLLLLVGMIIVFRLGWGWWVGRELEGKLAEIRKRGEPVLVSDVHFQSVADSENAWLVQVQAAKAKNPVRTDWSRSLVTDPSTTSRIARAS